MHWILYVVYSIPIGLFSLLIGYLLIRDRKRNRIKQNIQRNGVDTTAVITKAWSRSGGAGCLNITLEITYRTETEEEIRNRADAVINAMNTANYQPGKTVALRYLKSDPLKVILDIPHPLRR
ncbi:DUF3592 domain-containing protein [Cronobacter sakazakii]|uniref:DUF3592 domain-containing protein n=1 Tax=Cronobacter sakazakii TaxID=28141 RepID=UPI000CFD55C9|nr:DUF3592 domain-containing protein [Cronobacter sakazakii]